MIVRVLLFALAVFFVGTATAAARMIPGSEGLGLSMTHRVSVPGAARDGPLPTPTPRPPPPYPANLAHCYAPRPADAGGFVLSPASTKSVLQSCQVIGFYGYPGTPGLGVLAQSPVAEMVQSLVAQAAAYDESNGPRGVVPVFHLIGAVAQASPGGDGLYLYQMPDATIREWIGLAEQYGALIVLDIQMGTSTVDAEIGRVLPYLDSPYVHLAVDPEWAMPPGVAPGTIIGGMDASAINRAQELMSTYLTEHHLLDRMLLVHQFTDGMIRNKADLTTYPGVDLVIDTDGFGYASQKIGNYNRYIRDDGAPHGGMKLFYRRDIDLMTPGEVSALVPQPDFVTYE